MSRRSFPAGMLEDAVRGVLGVVKEVVPTDAQLHLLAAQRELILAVAAVIEHRTANDQEDSATTPAHGRAGGQVKGAGTGRKGRAGARRPTRVSLD